MIPLDTTKSQIYARELLNNFGSDYAAISRLAPLLQLLQEEANIKPVATIEFIHPDSETEPVWIKGNITNVFTDSVIVEPLVIKSQPFYRVDLKDIRLI